MWIRTCALVVLLAAVCYAQTPIWYSGVCGRSKYPDAGEYPLPASRRRLIVGGVEARPHEFPWQVSLRTPSGSHFCGGSVINEWWVVTASHCIDGDTPGSLIVVAGDHTRNDASNTVRQTLPVQRLFMHPQYDPYELMNDVALIKVSTPIQINLDVAPICAPDSSNDYVNYFTQCSGWGTLSSGGACCPQTLQYVTMNVTTNEFCDRAYPPYDITPDMICATDNNGSRDRDSCQGDSGGPLSIKGPDGAFHLIGTVSWGIGCASGYPGVYGRVTTSNNWITDTITNN
jgi:secreted trypsin-like serine protease